MSESGLMTSPGVLFTLNDVSSKKFTIKSHPVKASSKDISFSINKSAPFLLNTLCGYSSTTTITSPGSTPGASSDSPWKTYLWAWGLPLSISTSIIFFSLITFLPLHCLHLRASSIYSPDPPQSEQGPVDYVYIPGPNILNFVWTPLPLHPVQVELAPFSPPLPSHFEQILSLVTGIFALFPL